MSDYWLRVDTEGLGKLFADLNAAGENLVVPQSLEIVQDYEQPGNKMFRSIGPKEGIFMVRLSRNQVKKIREHISNKQFESRYTYYEGVPE